MRTFDRIIYGLLVVLVVGLFLSASAQVTPTIPNPSRVYGARMQGFTSHPAIGYEFFDATGTTNSHRYAYIRQQGGMVLSSSLSITNGRGGATTGHWDKDGSITVTGCTGCMGAGSVTDPYTPATGTFTIHGLTAFPDTQAGTYPPTYGLTFGPTLGGANQFQIFDDTSSGNTLWSYTTGANNFKWAISNALKYTMGASSFDIAGNGASDGIKVGGTLVITGQGTASFNATTVSTLHATGNITADASQTIAGHLAVAGGIGGNVVAEQDTTYTATISDYLIPINVANAATTVTLPAASALKGQTIYLKCSSVDAAHRLTVQRAGTDTIYFANGTGGGGTSRGSLCSATSLPTYAFVSDGASRWYEIDDAGGI